MKKQKGLGNKGFSLVELIVVIAIMAILVGLLAPTLIKYVTNATNSKDAANKDEVNRVATIACSTAYDYLRGEASTASVTASQVLDTYVLNNTGIDADAADEFVKEFKYGFGSDNIANLPDDAEFKIIVIATNEESDTSKPAKYTFTATVRMKNVDTDYESPVINGIGE